MITKISKETLIYNACTDTAIYNFLNRSFHSTVIDCSNNSYAFMDSFHSDLYNIFNNSNIQKKMTREEWLKNAVHVIDEIIFNNDLKTEEFNGFQIACGRVKGFKALGETIFPFNGDDFTLEDFFPVTIHVNCTIKDPINIIEVLTHECIHAFNDLRSHNKEFKYKATQVGFTKPFNKVNTSQALKDKCEIVYNIMKEKYGDFPGKAIVEKKKESKDGKKKGSMTAFCPNCGYEVKVSRKMFDKYKGTPTCMCGTKMGIDYEEEEDKNQHN